MVAEFKRESQISQMLKCAIKSHVKFHGLQVLQELCYTPFIMNKGSKDARKMTPLYNAPKVLISISLTCGSWRDFLSGILRYVDKHANWDIRITHEPGDLLAEHINELECNGYAGIILATPGKIDFARLCRSSIPLADCGGWPELRHRKKNIVHLLGDNAGIGSLGARHLLGRGRCAIYGFVRSRFDMEWSHTRQSSFIETVLAAGRKATFYELPAGCTQGDDISNIRDWLISLPKPAAIMADCDQRAAQVIAACRDGHLSVPEDIAVLGVDDDAFFTLHTKPQISSVIPDHAKLGYSIAAELDKLIKSTKSSSIPKQLCISPKGIAVRASTKSISSSSALARRAATFIRANATNGIKVTDVVKHLGCSRRIAEMRFHQVENRTIANFITDCRMKVVCHRLRSSDDPISAIAKACGFKTASHLSHLFKRLFSQSITDYRAQNRKT